MLAALSSDDDAALLLLHEHHFAAGRSLAARLLLNQALAEEYTHGVLLSLRHNEAARISPTGRCGLSRDV